MNDPQYITVDVFRDLLDLIREDIYITSYINAEYRNILVANNLMSEEDARTLEDRAIKYAEAQLEIHKKLKEAEEALNTHKE